MKIVQSFWSGNQTDFKNNYGWYSYKYNWLSWVLSCHQLVKYHKEVELYTDAFGYEILIEKLQLPYSKVHVVLDALNTYHKDLWAIAKIKTFELQATPFLHVDGDVFVWESLTDKFENSDLVTQNLESTTGYYGAMWNDILPHLVYTPIEMEKYHNQANNAACNMGIIGGTAVDFFKEYTKLSINFVDKNNRVWSKINAFNFNIFFEQVLFYQFATSQNKKIDFLFDEVIEDNGYMGFGDFHKVPEKTYLHLLGTYKRDPSVCKAMEIYIMKHYSESYSKVARLVNEAEGNQNEIEFLTDKNAMDMISAFDFEIKSNAFVSDNYLLKRDLYLFTEDLLNKLQKFLLDKENFTIVLLKGFQKTTKIINKKELSFLEIIELNAVPRIYELDVIDEIIISELSSPILYFYFINRMNVHFKEEGEEAKNELLTLLNIRLMNYIGLKIISIYS